MPVPETLPFPVAEYRGRAERVRAEMAQRGIDVLVVLSPANLCYLSGFESIWYPPRAPVGCVLAQGSEELVFIDYERHELQASTQALYDDGIFYTYDDCLRIVADSLAARGLLDGTVGVERWSPSPGAPLVDALVTTLAGRGARVVDGSWTVDRVRAFKSPLEVERVRRASDVVDGAFEALHEIVRPGLTELQIAARLDATMADLGGEVPAIRTMVSTGPLVWCRTHGAPTRRRVEHGDIMYVDACGVVDRYHVDLCRTFSIGVDHPEARAVLDYTSGSVDAVSAAVGRGDPLDVAQRAAEGHVFARYGRDRVWWVGGYALGIALPPNWVGHTYLSNDAFESLTWEPGYVTNYENIVFDREAAYTASYMETLMMGDDGVVRALSRHTRGLTVIG